ncbi:hypothetical protein HPP92_024201 [Vanilla planifolia]|uniref:Core Histone H2A/H2B/H3 domain-containing protein n=1 Tax=Vanilla planifolia TaxID=51239 RepID=A0A835PKF3_VANPL|nr:hypothetical protein HPP92_024201 [Vanilla planifolia]
MARSKHFSNTGPRPRRRLRFNEDRQLNRKPNTDVGDDSSAPGTNRGGEEDNVAAAGAGESSGVDAQPMVELIQRKKRRFRPGTAALREIRKLQLTWKLLIPAAAFIRIVKDITFFYSKDVNRWSAEALVAIQEKTFLLRGLLKKVKNKKAITRKEKTFESEIFIWHDGRQIII